MEELLARNTERKANFSLVTVFFGTCTFVHTNGHTVCVRALWLHRVSFWRRMLFVFVNKFVATREFLLPNFAVVSSLFCEICLLQRASFCGPILSLIVLSFFYLISFLNGDFVSPNFAVVVRLNKLVFCDVWVRLAEICSCNSFVLPNLFVATREFVSLSFVVVPSLSCFVATRSLVKFVSPNFVVTSSSC